MKAPIEWLKEYVPVTLTPKALAEKLTMAGLEVTAVHESAHGPVLDLEVTPNRPDWLSIVGVAREVGALMGQRLRLPGQGTGDRGRGTTKTAKSGALVIRVEDTKACPQYVGRVIEGVKIGPSPEWMQRRLLACGLRPINNVVDITNYVLLELGQPLHAFDLDRLNGGSLIVRRAKAGEVVTTLDGIARKLTTDMLVIADAKVPVAVAGVMGGAGSEVVASTRRLVLESAQFDAISVRRTARTLGVATESSYRFERGVDPAGVETASARAAQLLGELAGGRTRAVVAVGRRQERPVRISLSSDRLNRWLGTRLSPPDIRTTLAKLGCRVAGTGTALQASVPSFRLDLRQEVDLYEEVARVVGYDRIPARAPTAVAALSSDEAGVSYRRMQSLRCLCASLGLTEAMTWALVSEQDLVRCGYPLAEAVRVANPISQDHAILRPSLVMGLLQSVRRNLTQGAGRVALFEVGSVAERHRLPDQPQQLGIVLSGMWLRDWHGPQASDFARLKGLVAAVTERLCGDAAAAVPSEAPWAERGQAAVLRVRDEPVGVAGLVARRICQALDLEEDVWYAEVAVERLLGQRRGQAEVAAPAAFPPVKRDLSIVLADDVPYAAVAEAIRQAAGTKADRVALVDRYAGKPVPAGKHSLTFALEYRDPARTLTAAEVDAAHQRIVQVLAERFGATLR